MKDSTENEFAAERLGSAVSVPQRFFTPAAIFFRVWANGKPESRSLTESDDESDSCASFDSRPPDHLSAPIAIPQMMLIRFMARLIAVTGSGINLQAPWAGSNRRNSMRGATNYHPKPSLDACPGEGAAKQSGMVVNALGGRGMRESSQTNTGTGTALPRPVHFSGSAVLSDEMSEGLLNESCNN